MAHAIREVVLHGATPLPVARLRESLQTLPFFGSGKAVWLQNCNFLGDDRTAGAAAVTEALAGFVESRRGKGDDADTGLGNNGGRRPGAVREGRLEFSDAAVGDIYTALQSELEGLKQDIRRLGGLRQWMPSSLSA